MPLFFAGIFKQFDNIRTSPEKKNSKKNIELKAINDFSCIQQHGRKNHFVCFAYENTISKNIQILASLNKKWSKTKSDNKETICMKMFFYSWKKLLFIFVCWWCVPLPSRSNTYTHTHTHYTPIQTQPNAYSTLMEARDSWVYMCVYKYSVFLPHRRSGCTIK